MSNCNKVGLNLSDNSSSVSQIPQLQQLIQSIAVQLNELSLRETFLLNKKSRKINYYSLHGQKK
jgi:hypothetical protein